MISEHQVWISLVNSDSLCWSDDAEPVYQGQSVLSPLASSQGKHGGLELCCRQLQQLLQVSEMSLNQRMCRESCSTNALT